MALTAGVTEHEIISYSQRSQRHIGCYAQKAGDVVMTIV